MLTYLTYTRLHIKTVIVITLNLPNLAFDNVIFFKNVFYDRENLYIIDQNRWNMRHASIV
jgi:hypothetical protein